MNEAMILVKKFQDVGMGQNYTRKWTAGQIVHVSIYQGLFHFGVTLSLTQPQPCHTGPGRRCRFFFLPETGCGTGEAALDQAQGGVDEVTLDFCFGSDFPLKGHQKGALEQSVLYFWEKAKWNDPCTSILSEVQVLGL